MPRDRFFVAGVHGAGARVALAPGDARKLLTVLRRQTGDSIQVVDAGGTAFAARLEVAGTIVLAVLEDVLPQAGAESMVEIVLAQAIPKGQKMDFIVEKATELGVRAIVPLRSSRVTGDRTGERKHERWQRIAASAARQAGRTRVPAVEPIADWATVTGSFPRYDRVYIPWEATAVRPLREIFDAQVPGAAAILIVVGPEGGFDTAEVDAARAAGATPISLGARILRTETAALVVIAALLYARGEL